MLIPTGHAVNATLYRKLPYDSIRDFTTLTLAGSSPLVLAVHPSLPAQDVKGLVALARARPGQLTYGSAGIGSSGHLGGALFDTLTGSKMLHIPYKGMSVAITDLMSGQVSLTFGTSLSVVPHVRSGRCARWRRPASGARRRCRPADGRGGGVPATWRACGTASSGGAHPGGIVQRLNAEIVAVLALAEIASGSRAGVEARSILRRIREAARLRRRAWAKVCRGRHQARVMRIQGSRKSKVEIRKERP